MPAAPFGFGESARGNARSGAAVDDDLHQLGGDFVTDADGILRLCHRSRRPDDRPAIDEILAAISRADQPPVGRLWGENLAVAARWYSIA